MEAWQPPETTPSGHVVVRPFGDDYREHVDPNNRPDREWAQPKVVKAVARNWEYRGLEVVGHPSATTSLPTLFGRGGIHVQINPTEASSILSDLSPQDHWGQVSVRSPGSTIWEKLDAPQYLDELGRVRAESARLPSTRPGPRHKFTTVSPHENPARIRSQQTFAYRPPVFRILESEEKPEI